MIDAEVLTVEEWENTHKDYKIIGRGGMPYILFNDKKLGTILKPAAVVKK